MLRSNCAWHLRNLGFSNAPPSGIGAVAPPTLNLGVWGRDKEPNSSAHNRNELRNCFRQQSHRHTSNCQQKQDDASAMWSTPETRPEHARSTPRSLHGARRRIRTNMRCARSTPGAHPEHTRSTPRSTPGAHLIFVGIIGFAVFGEKLI